MRQGLAALESPLPSGDADAEPHHHPDAVAYGHSHHPSHDPSIPRSRSISSTSLSSLSRQRSHSRSSHGDSSDSALLTSHPYQFSGVGSCPYSAPEVFYISSLYNNRPYRGCSADVWSCAIILFVMLLGRPPFMRPLAKTYGSNMRRCRHFVSVMKGEGFGGMSGGARDLLLKMMKMVPSERSSVKEIKEDPWYQGPLPSADDVKKQMEERVREVYRKLEKTEMIGLIDAVRKEEQMRDQRLVELEKERRMREVEGERERSAPLTPNSSTRSHFDPSLSPVSQMSSSRMQQLPPHSGFSYSQQSPTFRPSRKDSEADVEHLTYAVSHLQSYASDHLTGSLDESPGPIQPRPLPISPAYTGHHHPLDPSSSSPPSIRLLSSDSSAALSPSPPPSSVTSPSYPWAYR